MRGEGRRRGGRYRSDDGVIEGLEICEAENGIVLNGCTNVTVVGCRLHDIGFVDGCGVAIGVGHLRHEHRRDGPKGYRWKQVLGGGPEGRLADRPRHLTRWGACDIMFVLKKTNQAAKVVFFGTNTR